MRRWWGRIFGRANPVARPAVASTRRPRPVSRSQFRSRSGRLVPPIRQQAVGAAPRRASSANLLADRRRRALGRSDARGRLARPRPAHGRRGTHRPGRDLIGRSRPARGRRGTHLPERGRFGTHPPGRDQIGMPQPARGHRATHRLARGQRATQRLVGRPDNDRPRRATEWRRRSVQIDAAQARAAPQTIREVDPHPQAPVLIGVQPVLALHPVDLLPPLARRHRRGQCRRLGTHRVQGHPVHEARRRRGPGQLIGVRGRSTRSSMKTCCPRSCHARPVRSFARFPRKPPISSRATW